MTSICHQYYQVLLAQGICIGIGVGLIFIPSVALLSTYFNSKLALANGLAAAGSGLGGILYPIMFHKLNDQIGFGWTVRTIGLVMFSTLLIPIALFRVRVVPSKQRKLLDVTALRVPAYLTFVFGGLITFISLNIPFFYIQYFAISTGLSDDEVGFYLLSVITTGSVIGRVLPNFLANRINPFYIVSICTVICGGLMFALIDLSSFGGIVVIALLYGFFSGAFISLTPTCFVSLSPERSLIGTRMGMGYAIMTIGNLVGTPAAGAILQTSGFNTMWVFGGVMSVVGGFIMMSSRGFQVRENASPKTR
ncbi:hypothetical protein G7054_g4974 [Neopestalotiopsis clavispora]|nr:hypothetical protein G7054_g4974 [Neopestalotiopsis clavispora]